MMHKRHSKAKYTAGKKLCPGSIFLSLPTIPIYVVIRKILLSTIIIINRGLFIIAKTKKKKISSTVNAFLMIFTKLIVKLNILNEHLIFWTTCHFAVLYWDIALIRRYRSFSVCNFLNCSLIVLRIRTTVSNFQTSG